MSNGLKIGPPVIVADATSIHVTGAPTPRTEVLTLALPNTVGRSAVK